MSQFPKQKLHIAISQINSVLGDYAANMQKHLEYIEKAIEAKADVVLFPELSLTGYSLKDAVYDVAITDRDDKLASFLKLSKQITIIVGLVELSHRFEIFNTLLIFEEGSLKSKHRKVYLPTYGLFEEERYFSSGNRFRAFDSRFGRFGILICEDMWHPTSGVILAQDGASLIFVAAAGIARGMDAESKPENVMVWESLNRSLAISTTSYVIFANRVGVEDGLMFWGGSEVIEPSGNRLAKAGYFQEEQLVVQIDLLKLKHARINTTLLSDEKLDVVIDELTRIKKERKEY